MFAQPTVTEQNFLQTNPGVDQKVRLILKKKFRQLTRIQTIPELAASEPTYSWKAERLIFGIESLALITISRAANGTWTRLSVSHTASPRIKEELITALKERFPGFIVT